MVDPILLVEDDEDDAFAFRWSLAKTQVDRPTQVVTDGRQAVAYLRGDGKFADREEHPVPCVIFLDLKLPFLNGHEVLAWIRQQSEYADLPVVILSGSDEDRDHKRAEENGANGYLVKPVNPAALAAAIETSCTG